MCDEKKKDQGTETHASEAGASPFDRCAPMVQRMLGVIRESTEAARSRPAAQEARATDAAGATDAPSSQLEPRDRELVALGAALGSNCVPCIEYHVPQARNTGLTDSQIREAIRFADQVRRVPARKVLDAALRLVPADTADAQAGPDAPPPGRGATAAGGPCCG